MLYDDVLDHGYTAKYTHHAAAIITKGFCISVMAALSLVEGLGVVRKTTPGAVKVSVLLRNTIEGQSLDQM